MGGHGTIRLGSTALDGGRTPPLGTRADTLQPGALLDGRYRILNLLGTGGMGSVYRAEHEAIGRTVAVKVLHPEHCASPAERDRFRREARVAVRLRSPHVVETLDFGEDPEGRLFLVMELLHGEPVRAVLAREGQLAPERVVRLLRQLLAGLEGAGPRRRGRLARVERGRADPDRAVPFHRAGVYALRPGRTRRPPRGAAPRGRAPGM